MSRLFGVTLWLLMPISWNVSSGSSQLYASLAVFLIPYNYSCALELYSSIPYKLEGFTFILIFIHVLSWSKFCPSLINNISLRIPSCSIRNFTQFSVARKNCPSSRCTTATNLVCSNMDIFGRPIRSLKEILLSSMFHFCYVSFI